ncbi:MAG TPA: hypothetical protein PLZ57_06675, partial [Pseudobdellovibrionaceae bacterium]|nr:hypothetical protein [Pseudobdellovibrionaceae bacterium]
EVSEVTKISMPRLDLFKSALGAMAMVSLQFVQHELAKLLLPQTAWLHHLVLLLIFVGFAAGHLPWVHRLIGPRQSLALGSLFLLLPFALSSIVEFCQAEFVGRATFILFLVWSSIVMGVQVLRNVYVGLGFLSPYQAFNFLAAFTWLSLFGLHMIWGWVPLAVLTGGTLMAIGLGEVRGWLLPRALEIRARLFDSTSVYFGICASLFTSVVLEATRIALFPTGLEFVAFQFVIFVMLGLAATISLRSRFSVLNSSLMNLTLGTGAAAVVFMSLSWSADSVKLWLRLSDLFPIDNLRIQNLVWVSVFMLPYFFFARLLPHRERESAEVSVALPGEPSGARPNHLFSFACGNAMGYALFIFALIDFDLSFAILTLIGMTILAVVVMSKALTPNQVRYITMALAAFMLILGAYVWKGFDLDRALILQGRSLLTRAHLRTESPPEHLGWLQGIFRRRGDRGYVLHRSQGNASLGLGGYNSRLYQPFDVLRSRLIHHPFFSQRSRPLVFGMGNGLAFEGLLKQGDPQRVRVVDNFAPFELKEFRDLIRHHTLTTENNLKVTLTSQDALTELFVSDERHDLIVWNLTWPSYSASRKLLTQEVFARISQRLSDDGIFVFERLPSRDYDCLVATTFSHVYQFPGQGFYPAALLLAANSEISELNIFPKLDRERNCASWHTPTWVEPFRLGKHIYGFDFGLTRIPQTWNGPLAGEISPEWSYLVSMSRANAQSGFPIYVLDMHLPHAEPSENQWWKTIWPTEIAKAKRSGTKPTIDSFTIHPPDTLNLTQVERYRDAVVLQRLVKRFGIWTNLRCEELKGLRNRLNDSTWIWTPWPSCVDEKRGIFLGAKWADIDHSLNAHGGRKEPRQSPHDPPTLPQNMEGSVD